MMKEVLNKLKRRWTLLFAAKYTAPQRAMAADASAEVQQPCAAKSRLGRRVVTAVTTIVAMVTLLPQMTVLAASPVTPDSHDFGAVAVGAATGYTASFAV